MNEEKENKSYDFLQLANEPKLVSLLNEKQIVIFSCTIMKYNEDNKCQQRIFLLTNDAVYNILKTENIIKSLMKKLMSFQNKYSVRRRISLSSIFGVTLSSNKISSEFILHVKKEHDYHYKAVEHRLELLRSLNFEFQKSNKKPMAFFFKDQIVLTNYVTTKTQLKDKVDAKPKENGVFLGEDFFQLQKKEDSEYVCKYSKNFDKVSLNQFTRVSINNIRKKNKYYVIEDFKGTFSDVEKYIGLKHLKLIVPEYCFGFEEKLKIVKPFMIGGSLQNYIRTKKVIPKEEIIFYLSQLILFLEKFHKENHIYGNLTLKNIFIKENGYLILDGTQSAIKVNSNQEDYFDFTGESIYTPPEVILCEGYHKQIDIWKLGICAYFMHFGQYPYHSSNLKILYQDILQANIENCPHYISRMLEKSKIQRISIQQLKKEPEFKEINWEMLDSQFQEPFYKPEPIHWKGKIPIIVHFDKNN